MELIALFLFSWVVLLFAVIALKVIFKLIEITWNNAFLILGIILLLILLVGQAP